MQSAQPAAWGGAVCVSPSSPLTCVDSHVVLVIRGTGEAPSAVGLWTHVRPLACVCSDMNLADVGCGKRAATAHKGALEGTLTCIDRVMWMRLLLQRSYLECPGHPYPSTPVSLYSSTLLHQRDLRSDRLWAHFL